MSGSFLSQSSNGSTLTAEAPTDKPPVYRGAVGTRRLHSRRRAPFPEEIRILSPTAILGYGFPETSFEAGLSRNPHVIAIDAGSSDPGPFYLGAGLSFTDRATVKRDLRIILKAARSRGIPVIVGSAGGAGAAPHLAWTRDIVLEVAHEESLSFRLALLHADVDRALLRRAFNSGRIEPLGFDRSPSAEAIDQSTHIVAQMGVEPFVEALEQGADVILAGRAYDPAVFAAFPIWHGFDIGLALHLGKILECAAIACTPGSGSDCMLGTLQKDSFLLRSLNPGRRCTIHSIAAHSLYEKSDPFHHRGPGGSLDLTGATFEQACENAVRVSGSVHTPSRPTVKIEGARRVGFRTISIAGVRDPIMISSIDEITSKVSRQVADHFGSAKQKSYRLLFRAYGKDAVMGPVEIVRETRSHELGIVVEAVAETQSLANTVCSFARSTLLHYGYEGRIATAGNLAFPYSPSDIPVGEVFEFSLYHLLEIEDPVAMFPIEYEMVGASTNDEVQACE